MNGYVYLIGSKVFGWYKIGKSKTPDVRINNLGILLPFKIEIYAIWKANNHHAMEKALHEMYSKNCINGEWFEFTHTEIKTLLSIPAEKVNLGNLTTFSNIDVDLKKDKHVAGVKIKRKKLHKFTEEECEQRKIKNIAQHQFDKNKMLRCIDHRTSCSFMDINDDSILSTSYQTELSDLFQADL